MKDLERKQMPLIQYMGAVILFNYLLGRLVFKKRGNLNLQDTCLLGIATHKLSRVITKDLVTTPFRIPFTKFQDYLGFGETQEEAKGTGLQQMIGELVSCNYCADLWITLGFVYGLDKFPEKTRFLFKFFSAAALADFLHVSYETTRTRENVLTLREQKLEREEKSRLFATK